MYLAFFFKCIIYTKFSYMLSNLLHDGNLLAYVAALLVAEWLLRETQIS